MPIEVTCSACQHRIRVPDKYAGKKVKCPTCDAPMNVPVAAVQEMPLQPSKVSPAPVGPKPRAQVPRAKSHEWHLQTANGQEFGPVDQSEIESWVAEGRIDSTCQLLRDDWDQWRWAHEVYPQLAPTTVEPVGIASSSGFPQLGTSDRGVVTTTSEDQIDLTPPMIRALAGTRPWVMFIGVLFFIGVGFGAIGTLLFLLPAVINASKANVPGSILAVLVFMLLLNIVVITLYFFAAYYLVTYSSKIGLTLATKSKKHLEAALVAQKSFWKLVGITTLVAIVLYVILYLIIMSAASSGHIHPPINYRSF